MVWWRRGKCPAFMFSNGSSLRPLADYHTILIRVRFVSQKRRFFQFPTGVLRLIFKKAKKSIVKVGSIRPVLTSEQGNLDSSCGGV